MKIKKQWQVNLVSKLNHNGQFDNKLVHSNLSNLQLRTLGNPIKKDLYKFDHFFCKLDPFIVKRKITIQ